MKKLILLSFIFGLLSCTSFDKGYPSVKKECEIAGPNSEQCHIYNLGYYFEHGIYVDKDIEKAEYWYGKVVEKGYIKAKNNLKDFN